MSAGSCITSWSCRCSHRMSRIVSISHVRRAALGLLASACALLPNPEVSVKTLRAGSFTLDSSVVSFDLRPGVTQAQYPEVCMSLDTLRYTFRPKAEQFHPLELTDTTIYARNDSTGDGRAIALTALLEAPNGDRVNSGRGDYAPGNGEEGEVVCLGFGALPPNVTYTKLRLRSTVPVVVKQITWHYFTRT
jgi:hypothetical protein